MVDILLVEDDSRLAQLTKRYLQGNGFTVVVEPRGDNAIARFHETHPRLVLLDLMLPGLDGLNVCQQLRKVFQGPVLMLTAKDADLDQVIGLSAGADDYVVKPADPMVLLARIRALLRRFDHAGEVRAPVDVVLGGLRISAASQQTWLNGVEISLSTQEFELLSVLARNAGVVLTREELFHQTRGIDYDGLDRSIDVRISKLRKKLGDDPSTPHRIKTIWGKGYLLAPDVWGPSS